MSPPKTIRVDETASQRAARLRSEMHAVGDPPPADAPKDERAASDQALTAERVKYMAMELDAVFETEAKLLLALPLSGPGGLWPKDRANVLKSITGYLLAKTKLGQEWGVGLNPPDDEDDEEPE